MTKSWEKRKKIFISPESEWLWLGPLLFMVVVGIYFPMRYAGHWAESDSATFTYYIQSFIDQNRLIPKTGIIYPNGFAYQAISAFALSLTGLGVASLQQWVYPLLAALVVLPAWVLYRDLTGSNRAATLTTILLFTQPEFLFVILRSSHEKFTRTLMFICLFWLVRSLALRHQPKRLAVYIVLLYLTAFSMISSNNLLANSFIFAIATAMVIGLILEKRNPGLKEHKYILKRLPFTTTICLGLVYIFTFYVYPPAQHDLVVFRTLLDRIAALFLDVQAQTTNAYAQVSQAWVSLPTYFIVSISNWIILFASFGIWLRQTYLWIWRSKTPKTQMAWILWLLYATFAVQGALSVISDASGALTSNLQHRIFSSFMMIAVAVVGMALADWHPPRYTKLISLGLTVGIFCISILSVMKATNEPLLSNKWTFYQPNELVALEWGDTHLKNAEIWTEFDERLIVAYYTLNGGSANDFTSNATERTRNRLVTTITRLRGYRIHQPLPVPPDAFTVYDNGMAQLYHLKPQTPYQP